MQVNLSSLGNPQILDFPTVSGTVSGYAAEGGYNGPDGGPYWGGVTDVPAYGGISGVRDADATMFLVGVFLGPSGQPVDPPPTLNVTNANNIASFSPVIGQQFFIGNGLTSSQALQTFNVPVGATRFSSGSPRIWDFPTPICFRVITATMAGRSRSRSNPTQPCPLLTALTCFDRFGGHRTVGHVHRDRQRPVSGRGHSERGDVTFSDQSGAIGSATLVDGVADVHDLEPGGGHGHDHGLLRRHRGLRPEQHGHDRDGRRQRHRRLQGQRRPRDRRRAELSLRPRLRLRRRPVHRRREQQRGPRGGRRRPATSSPSPATARPVTAATAGPPPPPS